MKSSSGLATSGAQASFGTTQLQIDINDLATALAAYEANQTTAINTGAANLQATVNAHINSNFGDVHGVSVNNNNKWKDSGKDTISLRTLTLWVNHSTIGVVQLKVPLSTTPIFPT